MKLNYYKRIFGAYLFNKGKSNLKFWHTSLIANKIENTENLGRYYMNYIAKTEFEGPFDKNNIPMLDYKGALGIQYNPNAIAQYALGFYDLYLDTGKSQYKEIFLKQANWFVENIRIVEDDIGLWEYKFDFEYHKGLKAPWRSALAQGQGISVVIRAFELTQDNRYLDIAEKAFKSFFYTIDHPGGVTYKDKNGYTWFEELVFNPPTHVLNGFIWALWGVYDYYLVTHDNEAHNLYIEAVRTLEDHIHRYDLGFWSVYHLVPTTIKMIVSTYYQRLHIVQLEAMFNLTGKVRFKKYSEKWKKNYENRLYRFFAIIWKIIFKLLYY